MRVNADLPKSSRSSGTIASGSKPLVLCDLINLYASELGRSRAAAAWTMAWIFARIEGGPDGCLDRSVCWVGTVAAPDCVDALYRGVPAYELCAYFSDRSRSNGTASEMIECPTICGVDEPVPDAAIAFAPAMLADLIIGTGHQVPRFLQAEIAPSIANVPASPMDARELATARRVVRAIVAMLSAAAQDKRTNVRKLAAQIDLDAANYTTAKQLAHLAELLDMEFPKKPETVVKFLQSPDAGYH